MKTTFLNDNAECNVKQSGLKCMQSRAEDFNEFMNNAELYESGNDELPPFNEYGLCFDYVEPGTFRDQSVGYHRYQLSTGGPGEEVRFYADGTIEFVYLDWFCGVGFDVTSKPWAMWLRDEFNELGMLHS